MQNFSQRLFRSIVPSILFILITAGVLLDVLIAERLEEEFDQLLVAKSQGLVALSEFEENGFMVEQYERALPQFTAHPGGEYFQFQNDEGQVLLSSESMPQDAVLAQSTSQPNRVYLNVTLPDGRQGRLLRSRFLPRVDFDDVGGPGVDLEMDAVLLPREHDEVPTNLTDIKVGEQTFIREPLVLNIAISRENLDKLIWRVHMLLITAGLLTMAAITWLAHNRIRETVKPLKSISKQVRELNPQDLDQRVDVQSNVTELDLMVQQINQLLTRVGHAFQRERRFSGDVAHELRTPLAELRTLVEVRERFPDDPELAKHFLGDVGQATRRMQRTIEALLALSRSEGDVSNIKSLNNFPVVLAQMLDESREFATQHGVTLLLSADEKQVVVQGRDEWPLIISNLLSNSIEYSKQGSSVFVALEIDLERESLQMSFSNTVDDLMEADMPHLFERLWRKDSSRTSTEHSGLGLALVKACADRVGAEIDCQLHEGELRIALKAPLQSPETD